MPPSVLHQTPSASPPSDSPEQSKHAPGLSPEPLLQSHSPPSLLYSQLTCFLVRKHFHRRPPLQPFPVHRRSPKHRIPPEHICRHRRRRHPRSTRCANIVHLPHILRSAAQRNRQLPIHSRQQPASIHPPVAGIAIRRIVNLTNHRH